jgi:hypothetical protein
MVSAKQTFITDYFSCKKRKQKYITDYFSKKGKKKVCYGYNDETGSWHCTMCGLDMGIHNPRQLCGKIYCYNYDS